MLVVVKKKGAQISIPENEHEQERLILEQYHQVIACIRAKMKRR